MDNDIRNSDPTNKKNNKKKFNIQDELIRRDIKFLNVNVDLAEGNKPQLTFENLDYPNIKSAELVSGTLKYVPFLERCEAKFVDNSTTKAVVQITSQQQTITSSIELGTGTWSDGNGTLTLNSSFTRPGIYTGVIKIKKKHEKDEKKFENYIVSFKKYPSDYISYESLEITAGLLKIKNICVSDGYKNIKFDCLDKFIVSYEGKEIDLIDEEKKSKQENSVVMETQEAVTTGDTTNNSKNIEVNLLKLVDYGRLKAGRKIKLTAKYFGIYEVSAYILLVETKPSVPDKKIFISNEPEFENSLRSSISSVFNLPSNDVSSSIVFSTSTYLNSNSINNVKLYGFSVVDFEQTYGSTISNTRGTLAALSEPQKSTALGGANLDFKFNEGKDSFDISINYDKSVPPTIVSNPEFISTSNYFVYTERLASYSRETYEADNDGPLGLIGNYYFKVGKYLPKLYFESLREFDVKSTTDKTKKNIIFTYKKIPGYAVPQDLVSRFQTDWKITPSLTVELTDSDINQGYNSMVVEFTYDSSKDIENIKSVISTFTTTDPQNQLYSSLKLVTPTGIPTVVKTTLIFPVDKIDGYMISPKIAQITFSKFKATFPNIKPMFDQNGSSVSDLYLIFGEKTFTVPEKLPSKKENKNGENDIVFDIQLDKPVNNDQTWELKYKDKTLESGIYVLPKLEAVNISEFLVEPKVVPEPKPESILQKKNTDPAPNPLDVNLKFENLEGEISLEKPTEKAIAVTAVDSGASTQQNQLQSVTLSEFKFEDLDKIVSAKLEIKESEVQSGKKPTSEKSECSKLIASQELTQTSQLTLSDAKAEKHECTSTKTFDVTKVDKPVKNSKLKKRF